MNLAVSQSENFNLNVIKNINDIDYQDSVNKTSQEESNHLHGRKPLKIRFFANGDKFFPGKKISIHSHRYQNLEELMTELTYKMPPQVYLPNGIRQLFTSSSGRRISEISQLESGKDYICAGNENYKSISYGKTEKEPWFRGRPHNFSRYPQLMSLGLGPTSQNPETNFSQKLENRSHYLGQNAFPTRFYRPTGQTYLPKNIIGHFPSNAASHAYPKLIKFKSKATNNKNVNYYQELFNQQSKPKVITVIRNGPEKPKCFVRILLNKRIVQSYETLLSDIENSLRDHSPQKFRGIGRIYNLLGKEIKSVGDFFRNEDFFIAVGDNEHLDANHVKDILDDMYPNHTQTTKVLKYWTLQKYDEVPVKNEIQEPEKSKNICNSSMTVDKRDSGFDEQNFSKESEFNSFNNGNENVDTTVLPKPALSKSKPRVRKKRIILKDPLDPKISQESVESSDNLINYDKFTRSSSPTNYQNVLQERNADRLRVAYEEREQARLQFQDQLKTEREKLKENIINYSNLYSQKVRKSISERGSINVFKRMDVTRQEARKKKMRDEMTKSVHKFPENNNEHKNSMNASVTSSQVHFLEQSEINDFPLIEMISQNVKPESIKDNDSTNAPTFKIKQSNFNVSPPVGKLNKINEDPSEYNAEYNVFPNINEQDKLMEKSKKLKYENNQKRSRNHLQEMISFQQDNNNKSTDLLKDEGDHNDHVEEKEILDIENIISVDVKEINVVQRHSPAEDIKMNKEHGEERQADPETPIKIISSVVSVKDVPTSQPTLNEEVANGNEMKSKVNPSVTMEPIPTSDSKNLIKKPNSEKVLVRKSSFPGSVVMGKLCRQIPSADLVYQRFEVTKLLGDGNFAIVKLAFHKKSKAEYALKIIDKARMLGKESMIENEIWIMKLCNHENIIKLKEEYETREEVFLVMELVKSGDLFDAITQNVHFSETVASRMVSDIASALFYLHSRRIVHRDLKPENLMVLRHKDGGITLKLADFGLAMEIKKLIYTVCGTPTYVAPEILSETGYSLEVDLWALGVIAYILLCGFPPFRSANRDQEQLFEIIKSGKFEFISPYWDKISWEVKDLIKKLLVVDRKMRYTTIDVLSHKWLLSKGKVIQISTDLQRQRVLELEEEAKVNLEGFQRQKKSLRASLNREIQAAYQSQKNK